MLCMGLTAPTSHTAVVVAHLELKPECFLFTDPF